MARKGSYTFWYWRSEKNGLWYWHLVAANNHVVAQGQGYKRKKDLLYRLKTVCTGLAAGYVSVKEYEALPLQIVNAPTTLQ